MSRHSPSRGRRVLAACTATTLGLALALGSGFPAGAEPPIAQVPAHDSSTTDRTPAVVTDEIKQASGQIAAFVQLKGEGAYRATQPQDVLQGTADPVKKQGQVDAIASAVDQQAQSITGDSGTSLVYTTHNAVRGVAVDGDAARIRDLAHRNDVAKISLITPKTRTNSGTDLDTRAAKTWTSTGRTGKGVTIAVIDSGLDYTHADFGGPGTPEAYAQAKASKDMPAGLYDPNKVAGGYDLAGDAYDAENPKAPAQPDNNPLDCSDGSGHGTHVAGTAAGYGETKDGKTFRGDYSKLDAKTLKSMKIGPGSAPEAKLVSLRVFGCEGTTNLSGQAMDRALDPNQDGDFSDRADIINMSLGSDYGPYDDPENDIVTALAQQGVLTVIASGNAGDVYNVGGNPGSTPAALTVANSFGSSLSVDRGQVLAPADVKGSVSGDYSSDFDYASADAKKLTGTVTTVPESNRFGCEAFTGQDFSGKWVWLDWSDNPTTFPCGSKVRFDHAAAAGAKGVILTSPVEAQDSGIAGNDTIPGMRLSKSSSDKLRPAAQAGTLRIRLSKEGIGAATVASGSLDQLNPSSSRGEHGSHGLTKPDVAAPGTSIGSAGAGSGNGVKTMTGTSMATPHVAGIAALVKQAHPDYSAQSIKAAIMNTATTDVKDAQGSVYSVERVGSGRVDALRAVNQDVLVYNGQHPEDVSAAFGVQEVSGAPRTFTQKLTVQNRGNSARSYQVSFAGSTQMPGVSISTTPSVSVPAHGSSEITVTASVNPAALQKTEDPATEKEQLDHARQFLASASGRVVLQESGRALRVPVQIAPKPVSAMKASGKEIAFGKNGAKTSVGLAGKPLDQGGYVSSLAALQLGATSPRLSEDALPTHSVRQADLQYVGASSNVPALKDAKKDASNGMMGIGISTWSDIDALMPSTTFEVALDTNRDGAADYYVTNTMTEGLDYPQATLSKVTAGGVEPVDTQPINGSWGDTDTNTMDTNAFVLPVSLKALGIDAAKAHSIAYQVKTYSWLQQDAVDSTDWISYDPVRPALSFTGGRPVNDLLVRDAPGKLTAHRARQQGSTGGSTGDDGAPKALFLHLHNATGDLGGAKGGEDGGRAQVLGTRG